MRTFIRLIGAAALLSTLCLASPAMADKQEFSTLPPEQIEKVLRQEYRLYRQIMNEIRELENGPLDKQSAQYKEKLNDLIRKAEEHKVNLDSMREALAEQERAYK